MQSVERNASSELRTGRRPLLAATMLAVVAVSMLRADDFTNVLRIPEVSTDEELLNNIPTAGPLILEDPRVKQPLLMVPEDEVQLLPVAVPEKPQNTPTAKSQNDGWSSTDFPSLPGDPAPLPRFDDELKLVGFNGSATAVDSDPKAPTPIQSQPAPILYQPLEQSPLRIEAPLPSLPGDNDLLLAPVQSTSPSRPESGPIIEPTPSPTPAPAPSPPPRGGTQFTPPNIPIPTPNIPAPEPGTTPTPSPTPTPTPNPEPSSPAQGGASNLVQQIASRVSPAAISNPAAPSSTVQAASVATPAPASTGEIIERAISVSVRRTSPTNIDAKIRGFNTHQVTATADGAPQPKTRVDIDSYFSQIPAGLVENITVLDGPYSSLYGQGFGFFIAELFPTRQYDSPEFHGKFSVSQDTNAKTFYQRETAWGGGQNWSFVSSYGLRTASDYRSGGNFLVPAQYQTWDGFGSLSLRLTEHSRVEVQYLHPELNNMELPGVAYDLKNSTNTQTNIRYVVQDSPDEPARLMIQYWYGYTGYGGNALRTSKQTTFFQPFLANNYLSVFPVPLTNLNATGSLISQGMRGILTFGDKDETLLTVGADWRQIRNDFIQTAFLLDNSVPFFFDQFGIPAGGTNDAGVLMNITMPWSDQLNLTLGARGDIYTASFDPNSVAITKSPFYGSLVGFTQPSQVLGMVYGNAEYQVNEEVTTISGFGIAMRGPDVTELYSSGPFSPIYRFGNSGAYGNSDLLPEINIQFDLGANAKYDNANLGFRSYISNIFDYILAVPYTQADGSAGFGGNGSYSYGRTIQNNIAIQDTTALDYKYQNVTRASLIGCDFMGDYKINEWFSLAGRTSYTKGTNHDVRYYQINGTTATVDAIGRKGSAEGLPGIYPWNGIVALRIHEPTDDANVESRWGGDLHTRMVMGQNFVARSLGEVPSDGFTTLGIRAFWRPNQNLRFTLSVENLLNRNYAEIDSLAIFNPALGNNGFVFVPEQGIYALFGMEASF